MAKNTNPWGRKPGPGGRPPGSTPPGGGMGGGNAPRPDLDALLRQGHARMRGMFGDGDSSNEKRTIGLIVIAVLVLWAGSGFYRVNSDELGVVMRFGQYHRTTTPGLNYHLPFPVEQVLIPSVTSVNKVEVGYRGTAAENPTVRSARFASDSMGTGNPQNREGLMLTEDRNIVDIDFEVQWKIDASAPDKFLFNMRDPAGSIKAVAESAMREVIGQHKLDDVLTTAQSEIAEDTKAIMQQIFNEYDAGVEIIAVNLSRPDVPQPVIDEFQDVKRAEQNKETAESVAEGYRNEMLPQAKGEAAQMEQQALAYKSKVIADAEGDVARFNKIYAEYVLAKDVTKKRIYLETMEEVMKGMPKTIIDPAARGNGGMVQMLPVPTTAPVAPVKGATP